jgi:modulator of FtsH protease HflK
MIKKRIAFVVLSVLLAIYIFSGLTIVQPDEVGVVRRLGAVLPDPWEPGLHWGLPWGIDRLESSGCADAPCT